LSSTKTAPTKLAEVYDQAQGDWESLSEKNLASFLLYVRKDARLGEILVAKLAQHFEKFNPWTLNQLILDERDPQVLPVLCSFVELALKRSPKRIKSFKIWKKAVEINIPKATPQMFFLLSGYPRPDKLRAEFQRSHRVFENWGFHSDQLLVPKSIGDTSLLSKEKRLKIIDDLLTTHETINVRQYLQSLGGLVHVRTAERDLAAHPRLKKKGYTRSRVYLRR